MNIKKTRLYINLSSFFWSNLIKIDTFIMLKKLKNKKFTIIANDCVGGLIYRKFNLQSITPTRWVRIDTNLFCSFANNLEKYLESELTETNEMHNTYPIGVLKPLDCSLPEIKLFFVHDNDFLKVKEDWDRRKTRVNLSNVFVVLDGTDEEISSFEAVKQFNLIKYKKIYLYKCDTIYSNAITDKFLIDFNGRYCLNKIFDFLPGIMGQHFGRRYLDKFNLVRWLNGK